MRSNKGRYIIIFLAVGLLIFEIFQFDLSNVWTFNNFSGIIVPILIIVAMYLSVIHVKKHGEY